MGRIRTLILPVLALLVVSVPALVAPSDVRAATASAAVPAASTASALRAAPPTVAAVSPAVGSVSGGATVTVRGSGFRRVEAVIFGRTRGTRVTVLGPGRLTVRVPAHAAGRVRVTVRTRAGASTGRVFYRYLAPRSWEAVESGYVHTCALSTDHTVWCWGQNLAGQLGDGTTTDRPTRVRVGTASDWATLDSGYFTSCATKTDGTAWCWGFNGAGQLGDGTTTQSSTPVQVGADAGWSSLDGGNQHTCGIRTDGTAWCWGHNDVGQLGTITPSHFIATPVQVGSATTWSSISAGVADTCAVRLDGTAWCWGGNVDGQHGDGTTEGHTAPVQVGSGTTWATISVGAYHVCATRTDGTAWCWGRNTAGQLGIGSTDPVRVPTQVGVETTWTSVSAGDLNTCGTQASGAAYCWGNDGAGQLGDGERGPASLTPALVVDGHAWRSVGASGNTTCGLTTAGAAYCWGSGHSGERGDGAGGFEPTPRPVL